MNFPENFDLILSAISNARVEFMIAGGFAVNFHGYNRSTSDMDIWIKPVEKNKLKIFSALRKSGYSVETLHPVLSLDFTKPFSFSVGEEPVDVDIFNHITGVSYAEAEKNKINFKWNNKLDVSFISIRDLMVNKMLTGRTKDKLDVEELQRISALKKK